MRRDFSSWLRKLERKGIISRTPHWSVLFILSFIMLILGFLSLKFNGSKVLETPLYYLAGLGFLFATGHLIVVIVLNRCPPR